MIPRQRRGQHIVHPVYMKVFPIVQKVAAGTLPHTQALHYLAEQGRNDNMTALRDAVDALVHRDRLPRFHPGAYEAQLALHRCLMALARRGAETT